MQIHGEGSVSKGYVGASVTTMGSISAVGGEYELLFYYDDATAVHSVTTLCTQA